MKPLSAECFFLLMAGVIILLAALYHLIQGLIKRKKWVEVEGVIIERHRAAAQPSHKNFHLARLGYFIDGRFWESSNFVQIPKELRVGEKRKIFVIPEEPTKILDFNTVRIKILCLIALVCFMLAWRL